MTSEDIVRMARESSGGTVWWPINSNVLERFAALVATDKQEQIARQWDTLHEQYMADPLRRQMMLSYEMVAKMIRGNAK